MMIIKAQYILLLVSVCLLGAHAHNHDLGIPDSSESAAAPAAPVAAPPPPPPPQPIQQQQPISMPPPPPQQPVRQQPAQFMPQQPVQQPIQQQPVQQPIQQQSAQFVQQQQHQQPIPSQAQFVQQQQPSQAQFVPHQPQQPIQQNQFVPHQPQQPIQQNQFVPQQPIQQQAQFIPQQQQQQQFVSQQSAFQTGDFQPMDTISVIESQIARSHRISQMQAGFDASSSLPVSQGPSVLVRPNSIPSVPVRANFQQSIPVMPVPQRSVPITQTPQSLPVMQGQQQQAIPIVPQSAGPIPQQSVPAIPNVTPSGPIGKNFVNQQVDIRGFPVKQPNPLVTPPMNIVKDIPVDPSTVPSSELNPVNANTIINLPQSVITGSGAPKFCTFLGSIKCDPNFPYRSLDGSCNNLKNLWWGKDQTPYKRYLKPAYGDGQNQPRVSIDGGELPNPTEISCNLHSDSYEIEAFVTHIFMQWGQILNHDTTSLSVVRDEEKSISSCKSCKRTEKCMPMPINPNGKGLCAPNMKHGCVEFARSTAAFPDTDCKSSVREQINLISSFLDASFAYGNTPEDLEKLRDRSSGKGMMMLQPIGLLPQDINQTQSECLDFTRDKQCFRAGDDRVNQNPGLSSMQTIFIREHNRIARILSTMNPSWQDETVFQETRKIIIAQLQHITYNEYLPLLLGQNTAQQLGLLPGVGNQQLPIYDPNVDPRISNEYAAGAGRFGHSTIRPLYSRLDKEFSRAGHSSFMLRNSYFRSNMLYDHCQGSMESIIRGLVKDPLMKVDKFFAHDLTKHLFETLDDRGNSFHFDLAAINIQRARDNGIPSYSAFREACNLSPVKTWEDMSKVVPADVLGVFRQFYKFAEDVDLFPAMVSEHKEEGALVGPVIKCIVGQQFRDLKFGDRFWYETNQDPIRFTPDQLAELRKITLSKLLCRNMIDTPKMPPQSFLSTKFTGNDFVSCDSLPDINWSFWQS